MLYKQNDSEGGAEIANNVIPLGFSKYGEWITRI